MKEGIRRIVVSAAMTTLVSGGGRSEAAYSGAPAIVIYVSDQADVGGPILARAKIEAERIFAAAGVRVIWADSVEGPKTLECEGLNVFVTLLSPDMAGQRLRAGFSPSALGSSVPSAGISVIYSDRIKDLAVRKRTDAGILLGRVISHEVGHLVLPAPSHSRTGLMSPNMDTDPRGRRAVFTPQESAAIRSRVEFTAGSPEARATCGS